MLAIRTAVLAILAMPTMVRRLAEADAWICWLIASLLPVYVAISNTLAHLYNLSKCLFT